MTVHFICTGNIFRSLIAETYLKSLKLPNVQVLSSGTMADFYRDKLSDTFRRHQNKLIDYGYGDYVKNAPDQLSQARLVGNDIVILMSSQVEAEAKNIVELPINNQVWNILDTDQMGSYTEDEIYHLIFSKVDKLVESINKI